MMTQQTSFALVDCNNFYVSCERLFRPDLWHKPVAVLSNNDGCIVARSQEVKDLGIKMATPVHEVKQLIRQHQVQLFSSNYALYADISARVMTLLNEFSPQLEVYSIDEAFLDFSALSLADPVSYGQQIKQSIARSAGMPVCVGIGPTKTLAKLANYAAKKWPKTAGVVDLTEPARRQRLMRKVPVSEVWGVGRRLTQRLQQLGIVTVWDLCCQQPDTIQRQFNVVLARTVMELQGVCCIALQEVAADKQQIVCSRSFKYRITEFEELAKALAEFCSRAAQKLRQQHALAGSISVFIRTNPFNASEAQYQRSASLMLPHATADTRQIISFAKTLLKQMFRSGYRYQKCGVQLNHLQSATVAGQGDIFAFNAQLQVNKRQRLMQTLDEINARYAHGIQSAALGLGASQRYQPAHLSSHYTTRWDELLRVKCI